MSERIFANRLYVLESVPGLSGFQQWDKREYRIVTGVLARNRRCYVVGEYVPGRFAGREMYHEDGHMPEHQPKVSESEVRSILVQNPYASVRIGGTFPAER